MPTYLNMFLFWSEMDSKQLLKITVWQTCLCVAIETALVV